MSHVGLKLDIGSDFKVALQGVPTVTKTKTKVFLKDSSRGLESDLFVTKNIQKIQFL